MGFYYDNGSLSQASIYRFVKSYASKISNGYIRVRLDENTFCLHTYYKPKMRELSFLKNSTSKVSNDLNAFFMIEKQNCLNSGGLTLLFFFLLFPPFIFPLLQRHFFFLPFRFCLSLQPLFLLSLLPVDGIQPSSFFFNSLPGCLQLSLLLLLKLFVAIVLVQLYR